MPGLLDGAPGGTLRQMSVATEYPARRQPDGSHWYRPNLDKGQDARQWGWTNDPKQAHDDYQCIVCFGHPSTCDCPGGPTHPPTTVLGQTPTPDTPTIVLAMEPQPQEETMTDATELGIAPPPARVTQWAEYPLPPALNRPSFKFNQYGHYLLPDPITGLPVGFVRATTAAKTLDDTYNLSRWMTRTQVASVLKLVEFATAPEPNDIAVDMLSDLRKQIENGNGSNVNNIIERVDDFNGGKHAAEFGDAIHEWCGAIDAHLITIDQVPDQFRPWVDAYRKLLARYGFIAIAEYVERLVLNDAGEERIVGTFDRIFRCVETGELYMGDLKTSKANNLKWSWMTWPVQMNAYARARLMMGLDGKSWEPMPVVNEKMGLLIHLPSDAPNQAHMMPMNLKVADEYMATSLRARSHRKNAKHDIPGLTTPIPTARSLRWTQAFQGLQDARSLSDLDKVWEEFQDVWSDELTELGHTVAQLFSATQ